MTSYPGGKNGAGVYQTIINLMPPHDLYVEAFVGGGAVLLHKRPAPASIVIDIDADVAARWQSCAGQGRFAGVIAIQGDARSLIPRLCVDRPGALIYADPPYVRSARRDGARRIYRHEFTDQDHRDLLSLLTAMRSAAVMISGYRSALYDRALAGWTRIDYQAMTRGGPAVESLWLNYAPPEAALHDLSYVGRNYRERERIQRKIDRHVRRFAAMPALERAAILAALRSSPPSPAVVDVGVTGCGAARVDESHRDDPLAAANDDAGDRARGGRHRD